MELFVVHCLRSILRCCDTILISMTKEIDTPYTLNNTEFEVFLN